MATLTPEQERYGRISIVVSDILAQMLQEIIARSQMPSKALYDRIVETKNFHKKLSSQEWQVVKKLADPEKGFKVLDVSLAYKIITHFKDTFVTTPARGWRSNPEANDIEVAHDMVRIRSARNTYLHGLSINITEKILTEFFEEFAEVAKRIDLYLNKTQESSFESKLQYFRTSKVDENRTRETLDSASVVESQEGTTFLVEQQNKTVTIYLKKGLKEYIKQQISETDDADKSPFVLIFPEIQDEDAKVKAKLLNDFKDEINDGQLKFVFDKASKGSLILYVEVTYSLLEKESLLLAEIIEFLKRISQFIISCKDERVHVIIAQPNDELCDFDTDSETDNDMSEEELHIDHHSLVVNFRLKKEELGSEEKFQEGMKEFIETIVTIANGKHLTEKPNIAAVVAPGFKSENRTGHSNDETMSPIADGVEPNLDFNEPITNNMALRVDGFVCDKNNDCYQRGGTEKQGPFYESCTMTCPKTYLRIKKKNVRTDLRNFSPCTSELS